MSGESGGDRVREIFDGLMEIADPTYRLRQAVTELAIGYGALCLLVAEKGIATPEELEAARVRVRAEVDQQMAGPPEGT